MNGAVSNTSSTEVRLYQEFAEPDMTKQRQNTKKDNYVFPSDVRIFEQARESKR